MKASRRGPISTEGLQRSFLYVDDRCGISKGELRASGTNRLSKRAAVIAVMGTRGI